ncbi:MAG: hypothetical protein ACLUAR_17865 [Pilosibacter sp.]
MYARQCASRVRQIPTKPLNETLKGKLPQKEDRHTRGCPWIQLLPRNQIGLATGYVKELYHPGYRCKENGRSVPLRQQLREGTSSVKTSDPGDVDHLASGGRTGRDGIGGATGSSKVRTQSVNASRSAALGSRKM